MGTLAPGTSRAAVAVALGAVWLIWGSVYLGIRLVVEEVDPFQGMAQRFALAGVVLTSVVVARKGFGGMRVTRLQLRSLIVTGVLLLGLGNCFQALAQVKGLPSGVTALVVATVPAWAVLLRLLTGDRPATLTLVGVLVGFVGLVVLVALGRGVGEGLPMAGVALCIGSSISWTVGSWLQGRLPLPGDIFTIAAYQQVIAACCSATMAVATGEHFSMHYSKAGWFAMAHLVFSCSIAGFLALAWLLTHVPLSLTATHAYVNPVVAVLLGWLLLGEPIGLPVLVGGGIVISSVVLVVSAERRATAAPEEITEVVAERRLREPASSHVAGALEPDGEVEGAG